MRFFYLFLGIAFFLGKGTLWAQTNAALTQIISPALNNFCSWPITPAVKLKNLGSSPLTAAEIELKIDGIPVDTYQWNGSLAFLDSVTVQFPPLMNLTSGGHRIEFTVISSIPEIELDPSDNVIAGTFYSPLAPLQQFCENFSSSFLPGDKIGVYNHPYANTTLNNFGWELSPVSTGCHNQGLYLNSFEKFIEDETPIDDLILPALDLTSATSAQLKFDVAYRRALINTNIRLQVLGSTDCGEEGDILYDKTGAALSTMPGFQSVGAWTPVNCNQWRTETIDLTPYLGKTVYLTLRALTEGLWGPNLYIDNICLQVTRLHSINAQVNFTQACGGDILALPYTAAGAFEAGNTFTAQLSDPNGDFSFPQNIGAVTSSQNSGTINITLPLNLAPGSNYKIRIVSSLPALEGAPSLQSFSVLAPIPMSIDMPASACLNQAVNIAANPAIANATYQWECDGCLPQLAPAASGHITQWNTLGAKTIRLIARPPNGCKTVISQVIQIISPPVIEIQSAPTVCLGQSIEINAPALGGNATYTWLCNDCNPATWAGQGPHTLSWNFAGPKSLSLTVDQQGCISQAHKTIIVNLPPPLTLKLSQNVTCSKQMQTLSVLGASPGSVFTWDCQGCFPPPTTTEGPFQVSWLTPGVRMINVLANKEGCISQQTLAVNVKQSPEPVFGVSAMETCAGQFQTIQALDAGQGAVYTWNCDGCASSPPGTIGPHNVEWLTPGNKTLSLTVRLNECDVTVTQTISVLAPYPSPSLQPISVCGNGIDSISVPFSAVPPLSEIALYATEQSVTPLRSVSPSFSPARLPIPPVQTHTTFYIEMKPQTGCSSLRVPLAVNVGPPGGLPVISGNAVLCAGSTLNLTANGVANAVYRWQTPGANPSYIDGPNFTKANILLSDSGVYTALAYLPGCTTAKAVNVSIISPSWAPQFSVNSSVCQGQDLNFVAHTTPGVSFLWSGPNNFSRTTTDNTTSLSGVTLEQSGVYSLVAYMAGCTSLSSEKLVTVLPRPPMPAGASNSGPVCAGQSLQFTVQESALPNAQYIWLGPGGFSMVLNQTSFTRPFATVENTGIYSVALIVEGCTSEQFALTQATVYPIPQQPQLSTNAPICIGPALILSGPNIPGATYLWSGPNNFSATTNTATLQRTGITAQDSGLYSLQVVLNGCASSPGAISVYISNLLPAPELSGNTPLCVGQILGLTANPIANAAYQWSGPNNFSATTLTPKLELPNASLAAAGVYTVTYTVNGCSSAPAQIGMEVNNIIPPPPLATISSPICQGQTLRIETPILAEYRISGPNGFFIQANQNLFLRSPADPSDAGTYSIQTYLGGCLSPAQELVAIINPMPVAQIEPLGVVCKGQSLHLKAMELSSPAFYSWAGPGGFTATGSSATINNVDNSHNGVYTLWVGAPGCPQVMTTVDFQVAEPAQPIVISPPSVCAGADLTLKVTNIEPGVGYYWQGPDGWTSYTQNPTITRSQIATQASGFYTVTAVISGCSSLATTTDSIAIRWVEPPVLALKNLSQEPITHVCENQGFRLVVQNHTLYLPDVSYLWQTPPSSIAPGNGPILEAAAAQLSFSGLYTARAISQGCSSGVTNFPLTIEPLPALPIIQHNSPLCQGQGNLRLYALPTQGAAHFYWQGPNNFTATANPLIRESELAFSGIYSVTAISAAGCSSLVTTTSVVIHPTPALPTISSNSPICENQTLLLTVTSSPGATFHIIGPNGFIAQGTQTEFSRMHANASFGGLYSVWAKLGECSTSAFSAAVRVIPLPNRPNAFNNSPQCEGNDARLWVNPITGGVSYYWLGPNNFAATGATITLGALHLNQSGIYSVAALSNGCTSHYAITELSVTPAPQVTITGNSPVCEGDAFLLTITPAGVGQHTITGPGNFRAVSTTGNIIVPSITLSQSGVYTITSRVGSCSVTQTYQLRVKPRPSQPALRANTWVCTGQQLKLEALGELALSYLWRGPAGFSAQTVAPSYLLNPSSTSQAGVYSVNAILEGCTSSVATASVEVRLTPNVPVLQNDGPKCIGQVIVLSASGARNANYFWQGPDGFTATGASFQRRITSLDQAGVYSAVAILNGCSSALATTTVQLQQPNFNVPAQLELSRCSGENIILSIPGLPLGLQYYWSGPANFSSTLAQPQLANLQTLNSGSYNLQVIQNQCTTVASEVILRVLQTPPAPQLYSNAPICVGQTLRLEAGPIASGWNYQWSGPANFISAAPNPEIQITSASQGGIYRLQIKNEHCSSPEASLEVKVNPLPQAPLVLPSLVNVCQGQKASITTAASPQHIVIWEGPGGFRASGPTITLESVLPQNAGTYRARSVSNNCTSGVAEAQVIIRSVGRPSLLENNSPICEGDSLKIQVLQEPNTTYLWRGPNNYNALGAQLHFNPARVGHSGVYTVVAISNGCTSEVLPVEVAVAPSPNNVAIQTNAPLCAGNTLTFSASYAAGATYAWHGPNNFSSSLLSPTIPNAPLEASGVYELIVSLGRCSSRLTTNVVINATPPQRPTVRANTPLCQGQTLQLSAESIAGVNYLWQGPGGFSSTLPNSLLPNITPERAGIYSLIVYAGICSSNWVFQTVAVEPVPPIQINSVPAICAGSRVTLSASVDWSGASFEWRGPSGFYTPSLEAVIENAQPSASGVYRFTARKGICVAQRNVLVSVLGAPQGVRAETNAPLCLGQSLRLSAQGPAEYNYQWRGPAGFYEPSAFAELSPVGAQNTGVYTLTATRNNCRWEVATLPVAFAGFAPGLMPIQSNAPICAGETLQLSAPYIEGGIYEWTGPEGFRSDALWAARSEVTENQGGIYTLTFRTAHCPEVEVYTTNVVVKPLPSAPQLSSNAPICEGQVLRLTANFSPGNALYWSGPNGFVADQPWVSIPNATALNSGTYYAMNISQGCTSRASVLNVVIEERPPLPSVRTARWSYCQGEKAIFELNPAPGVTYRWLSPNGSIGTGVSYVIPAIASQHSGIWSVEAILGNCASRVALPPLSVIEFPESIQAYSNSPLCAGQNLQAWVTPSVSGANYVWQGPAGLVGTSSTLTLANIQTSQSGVYSVTLEKDGCQRQTTITIEVLQPPAKASIVGRHNLCQGQPLALQAWAEPSGANFDYFWSGPSGFAATGNTVEIPVANASHAGVYSLVAFNGACSSEVITQTIAVQPQPNLSAIWGETVYCVGQEIRLWAQSSPGASIVWQTPLGSVTQAGSTLILPRALARQSGVYTAQAILGNCSSSVASVNVVVYTPTLEVEEKRITRCAGAAAEYTFNFRAEAPLRLLYTRLGSAKIDTIILSGSPFVWQTNASRSVSYRLLNITDSRGCSASLSDTLHLEIIPEPEVLPVSSSVTYCQGAAFASIPLSLIGTGPWELEGGWEGGATERVTLGASSSTSPFVSQWNLPSPQPGLFTITHITDANRCGAHKRIPISIELQNCERACPSPSSLRALRATASEVALQWQPVSGGAVCYILSYGETGTDPSTWSSLLVPHPGNSYTLTGLRPGINYQAALRSNCSLCSTKGGQQSETPSWVSFSTLSSKQYTEESLELRGTLYPNPVRGKTLLRLQTERVVEARVRISNILGGQVMEKVTVLAAGDNEVVIDCQSFPASVYFVEVQAGGQKLSWKVVVE
jgi:hypothetical protein